MAAYNPSTKKLRQDHSEEETSLDYAPEAPGMVRPCLRRKWSDNNQGPFLAAVALRSPLSCCCPLTSTLCSWTLVTPRSLKQSEQAPPFSPL